MLGVQEVQAARDIQRDAAAAPPPAERVRRAAGAWAAMQRAEQVAALQASWTADCFKLTNAMCRCLDAYSNMASSNCLLLG